MDAIERFATGGSTIEDFAKHVFVKTKLTDQFTDCVNSLTNQQSVVQPVQDESIECVQGLLDAIEASLLHGLKAKLSLGRMLTPLKFVSSVSTISSSANETFEQMYRRLPDFWPVVLILGHNQVSLELNKRNNITTDVGRCRAWVRLALNEGLLLSYFDLLVGDISLLHGFYRPFAYLRDKEHVQVLRKHLNAVCSELTFELDFDHQSLNRWSNRSLQLIGIELPKTDSHLNISNGDQEEEGDNDDNLQPIMPAMDALKMLESDHTSSEAIKKPAVQRTTKVNTSSVTSIANNKPAELSPLAERVKSTALKKVPSGNSLQLKDGWSSSPVDAPQSNIKPNSSSGSLSLKTSPIMIKDKTVRLRDEPQETSYRSLLNNYSKSALLGTTPDFGDLYLKTSPIQKTFNNKKMIGEEKITAAIIKPNAVKTDYKEEKIIKSSILNTSKPEERRFLQSYNRILFEKGLDQQDYKCVQCARPIGLIYGRSRICKMDGFNYCLDCHQDEKALIPARVVHNWDFTRYAVARQNRRQLELTENEPLIDLQQTNSQLYRVIPVMKECLQLRTQLFYLHAYLFTCQEQVASDLRKLVWPNEHLFEHIHLYSMNDFQQVYSNQLMLNLKKSIQSARKHVISCLLCSQKGFICEVCRSPQIIYPFDIESTHRCDSCKAVFHKHCFIGGNHGENGPEERTSLTSSPSSPESFEDSKPCPRCIRIRLRESQTSAFM